MDNRPIKGNSSGQYNMNFIDPTNDICAYYGGMTQLEDLVEQYLETVTYHTFKPAHTEQGKKYNDKIKQEHFFEECSVCLQKFKEGQIVKILPCKHCFHQQCVAPWFSNNNHCPNCRFQLPVAKNQSSF